MIQKRQLFKNALMSLVQMVVGGAVTFVLYRFFLDSLGKELFGIWSLVLGTVAASNIAQLGLGTSAVKFVAKHTARDDAERTAAVIQTTILSIGIIVGVVLVVVYPLFHYILGVVIREDHLRPEAYALLPYALLLFWITSIASALRGCLDGFQRIDQRGWLMVTGSLLYLFLCFLIVPRHGLIGIIEAQIIQGLFLLIGGWFLVKRLAGALPLVPYQWSSSVFKEIFGYSFNFQIIASMRMLSDPLVKALLSLFGGVAVLSDFEMAHKLTFYMRSLIVTVQQAVVPAIADLQERKPDLIRTLYTKSFGLSIYIGLASLPFLIAILPLISHLWIGSYQPEFVWFATLLFVGWFVNMLAGPAFFANMGIGTLRWNVIGQMVIGIGSGVFGAGLGLFWGGMGVVVGYVFALMAGSITMIVAYHHTHMSDVPSPWLSASHIGLALASILALALSLGLYYQNVVPLSLGLVYIGIPILFGLCVAWPLWNHPMRIEVTRWLRQVVVR